MPGLASKVRSFLRAPMEWYYSKNATQLGPVSEGELRAKLASGEVSSADLVWRDGMPDWRPASTISELAVPAPGAPPPVPAARMDSPYRPPAAGSTLATGAPIPNYLWQSIVVTILCCWPLGIPAIVYAAKVDGLVARGDTQGALSAAASAKTWCLIALGSWAALIVVYGVFMVLMVVLGHLGSSS